MRLYDAERAEELVPLNNRAVNRAADECLILSLISLKTLCAVLGYGVAGWRIAESSTRFDTLAPSPAPMEGADISLILMITFLSASALFCSLLCILSRGEVFGALLCIEAFISCGAMATVAFGYQWIQDPQTAIIGMCFGAALLTTAVLPFSILCSYTFPALFSERVPRRVPALTINAAVEREPGPGPNPPLSRTEEPGFKNTLV